MDSHIDAMRRDVERARRLVDGLNDARSLTALHTYADELDQRIRDAGTAAQAIGAARS